MDPAPERPDTRDSEEQSTERTSMDRRSTEQRPVSRSRASSGEVAHRFASLATVFRFADFVSSLSGVTSEQQTLVRIIQRVRNDVERASRLRASLAVIEHCEGWPDDKTWIDDILFDIQLALNDIGAYVDNVKGSSDDGGVVKMKQKFEWVLSHHDKLRTKQEALSTCHQSLTAAIQLMQTVEMAGVTGGQSYGPIHELPSRPALQLDEREVYRSPHSRQKWRMSQKNLSLPSILISENDDSKLELRVDSFNSTPAELPGSGPDDLPDPDNRDLYADPPRISRTSIDRITPLPTVSEQHVENDEPSGAFNKTHSMPVLARSYRPRAVQVKRPAKHRSLPGSLPYLAQQPSLFTDRDLSDWVLPDYNRDSYGSFTSSSAFESPSHSMTSSPTMSPTAIGSKEPRSPRPERVTDATSNVPSASAMQSPASTGTLSVSQADVLTARRKPPEKPNELLDEKGPTSSASDSHETGSSNQTPSQLLEEPVTATSSLHSEESDTKALFTPTASTTDLTPTGTDKAAGISQERAGMNSVPPDVKAGSPVSRAPLGEGTSLSLPDQTIFPGLPSSTTLSAASARPQSIPDTTTKLQSTQNQLHSPTGKEAVDGIVARTSIPETSKPLTSHEKRRRAHARRMQAAYGAD